MSDKKISQLAASTTPLAGTEALPVVQSGVTKQVSVANLTAGRAVATGNLTTTGTATISSNAAIGTTTPNVNANRNTLTLQGSWGGEVDITVGAVTHARFGSDNFGSGYSCRVESQDSIILKTGAASNVVVDTGNLVIGTAGKGIDFSADPSAAGMTSELLDDYEEGAWTPALSDGTNSASFAANSGWYTKVGNLVTLGFNAYNLDVSGLAATTVALRITGVPFTSGSKGSYAAAALPLNLSGENLFLFIGNAATQIFINRATGAVDSTSLTRAGAGSPNSMSVYGQLSYNV